MADYRLVFCKMWTEDEWFASLGAQQKVLWIYLFTNDDVSVSGLYKIRDEKIALETGLSGKVVTAGLERFTKDGKIEREGWLIWVKKLRKYQASRSEKIATCIRKDLDSLSDTPLKRKYLSAYTIDSVSMVYRCTDSDTDSDTETDSDTDDDSERPAKKRSNAQLLEDLMPGNVGPKELSWLKKSEEEYGIAEVREVLIMADGETLERPVAWVKKVLANRRKDRDGGNEPNDGLEPYERDMLREAKAGVKHG